MEETVLRLLVAPKMQIIGFLIEMLTRLPSLVALPSGCKTSNCLVRVEGDLSIDAVTNWFATTVLSLPCFLYYSRESLVIQGTHEITIIIILDDSFVFPSFDIRDTRCISTILAEEKINGCHVKINELRMDLVKVED